MWNVKYIEMRYNYANRLILTLLHDMITYSYLNVFNIDDQALVACIFYETRQMENSDQNETFFTLPVAVFPPI